MKEFIDQFEKENITLKDTEGNSYEVEIQFLTAAEYNKIEKLLEDNNKTWTERSIEALIIACGKDKEFWMKFSLELLTNVSKYVMSTKTDKKKQTKS